MNEILKKISEHIQDKKVLIACSTGVDSMVLLNLIMKASTNLTNIVVVHINHQRRSESDTEESFMKEFCFRENIRIYSKKLTLNSSGNFQDWARDERYQYFLEVAKLENVDLIMTAHHGDDNLETILMRIIKISSLKGYGGIEEWSMFHGYPLYRPLLYTDKEYIIYYAKKEGIVYFEDSSNYEDDYLRNRIRKYAIPALKEENPSLMKAVQIYSETIQAADLIVKESVNLFIKKAVQVNNNTINIYFNVSISLFLNLDAFMQVQVLFELLKLYRLSRFSIDEIIKQIKAKKNRIVNLITPDLLMIKEYGNLIFTKPLQVESFYLKIDDFGIYQLPSNITLEVKENICNFKAENLSICYNIQELPIIIRNREETDRIQLRNGSKKVSDYLTDKKVPYLIRKQVLLLCDKDNKVKAIIKPPHLGTVILK